MGNPKGVKRDFVELERRRLKAIPLLEQGLSQGEIARRVGVHRQSVSRWARQYEVEGRPGLKRAGRAGRKPQLNEADWKRIEAGLKRGPEALGYSTSLWTAARVADLVEQQCGVKFSIRHVWWLLRQMGWSCQRPTPRALERNEAAIRRWKRERWPTLKKTLKNKAKPSFSSMKAD